MSKYTTEVRYICETISAQNGTTTKNVDDIINTSWRDIFGYNIPFFDEAYRAVLCRKILKHYYTREIGLETYGLWKLKLQTKMNEIMPYYNQLYSSELLTFNPLYDTDVTTTHKRTGNVDTDFTGGYTGTGKTTTNTTDSGNSVSRDRYSDTPQGSLENILNNTYLTNARVIDGEANNTNNVTSNTEDAKTDTENTKVNSTEEYVTSVVGKTSGNNYSELITKYRETFINIDIMVINDLEELFMQLW